jgi:hypothetical protein
MPGKSWVSRLSLVELESVPVPEVLSSPHRLTLQLQKSFSVRRSDSYGRLGSSRDDIDVKVAPASVPREALRRSVISCAQGSSVDRATV